MKRIRTIQGVVDTIRAEDPGTAITAHHLRALVRSAAIPSQKAGCKYLVAVEDVLSYFDDQRYNAKENCHEAFKIDNQSSNR